MEQLLRSLAPMVLALACAGIFDRLCRRRRLVPPGFELASGNRTEWPTAVLRRLAAGLLLTLVLWLGVFAPLAAAGGSAAVDTSRLRAPQLFLLHAVLLTATFGWYVLGFAGSGRSVSGQFGLRARGLATELGLGLVVGFGAWMAVIAVMILAGMTVWSLGKGDLLPDEAPALVGWLAGLPLVLRAAVSLSAGFAEEVFFRGFLQPRTGILFSSGLFVLAHLSYDQPFMLLGITLLSLVFALLVRWRQSIWAAVSAHATFDAIQLLFVIPWALEHLEGAQLPIALMIEVSR